MICLASFARRIVAFSPCPMVFAQQSPRAGIHELDRGGAEELEVGIERGFGDAAIDGFLYGLQGAEALVDSRRVT